MGKVDNSNSSVPGAHFIACTTELLNTAFPASSTLICFINGWMDGPLFTRTEGTLRLSAVGPAHSTECLFFSFLFPVQFLFHVIITALLLSGTTPGPFLVVLGEPMIRLGQSNSLLQLYSEDGTEERKQQNPDLWLACPKRTSLPMIHLQD